MSDNYEQYPAQALICDLLEHIANLEAELADWQEGSRIIMEEKCPPDEKHCTCVPYLRKQLQQAQTERNALRDGHKEIIQWANAYPLSVFPEPDLEKAHELLQAEGMTLDAISANAMRHVLKGVVGIAETPKLVSSRLATVRLIPSTVTEPLRIIWSKSCGEAEKVKSAYEPDFLIDFIIAVPSTCP